MFKMLLRLCPLFFFLFFSFVMPFSLRERLAQSIMPRLAEEEYFTNENVRKSLHTLIREEGIGGVCVFGGDALKTAQMLTELQHVAARSFRPPLLVSADFEHGVAMRLTGGTAFPHAMALGSADDVAMTERVAHAIALEAKAIGVHWNFAPVGDVNCNPSNPIINIRSFGETPDLAARHVSAYIRGTQRAHILASVKHFPGHGDTATDSHLALPSLPFERTRLEHLEFIPFRAAVAEGVRSVMVGHLAVPSLDDSGKPASLSEQVMTRCLREELGFTGIIVTDALDMHAITRNFSNEAASVGAYRSGADVVLLPPNPLAALDALEQAVLRGEITETKVNASARAVLEAKQWCELLKLPAEWTFETLEKEAIERIRRRAEDVPQISKQDQSLLALDAMKNALRWFGERDELQPLLKFTQIAGFALLPDVETVQGNLSVSAATNFFRYLGQNYPKDCDFAFIDENISNDELSELILATHEAEAIVFAIFVRPVAEQGSISLSERFHEIARMLAGEKPSVAVLFGNPYLRETFPANAYLCAFSHSEPALGAAAFELVQRKE